ncbi:MAG TPA: tetratricopeptide repeat protein, partial [Candidatus Sulfotelmatobacter sp.]|nr:tetratricopeptide repeat protein [Candidatus Sulfotelmatobacter sp.]
MSKIVALGLLALALWNPCLAMFAQESAARSQEVQALHAQALALCQQGQYFQGMEVASKALRAAQDNLGEQNPLTAACLGNLAACYSRLGRYSRAEPLYQQA